jgi:HSP20 family protein
VLTLELHDDPSEERMAQQKEVKMAVLRFDPFRDLDRLTEQMLGVPAGTARAPRFMPMDLYRVGDHYVLNADLPGVDPGSVDVSLDNGTLTIRAERSAHPEESVQWIASERFTGTFMRQLSLGDDIDADRISAAYANGVLTLTLPVAEKAKARRIDVQAHGDSRVISGQAEDRPGVTST